MGTIDIIVIIVYMLAMIGVGLYANTKIKTTEDFVLGGRRFGVISLVGTIMATMMGSGMVIGMTSNVYQYGVAGSIIWQYGGMAIGMFAIAMAAKKIRETGAMSFASVINKSFGKAPRIVAAVIVVLYAIAILAITVSGLRTVLITIFGDSLHISDITLTVLATLIAIIYTSFGGFFAVVWTDVIQFIVIVIGIFIIGPILGVHLAGGVDNIVETVAANGGSMTHPVFSTGMLGLALSYFLSTPGDPVMPQRVLAGKNDGAVKKAFIISGFMSVVIIICLLLLGGSIAVILPGLENPDAAISTFVLSSFPPFVKGIVIAALLAAIMSTFDSFLVLGTTHCIYDIAMVINPDMDEKKSNIIQRIAVVVFGILTVIIALYVQSILGVLSMVFSILGAVTIPALVSALWFKDKVTPGGVIAGMIAGCLVPGYLFMTKGYDVFLGDPVFSGLIASVAAVIIGSLIFKNKKKEQSA